MALNLELMNTSLLKSKLSLSGINSQWKEMGGILDGILAKGQAVVNSLNEGFDWEQILADPHEVLEERFNFTWPDYLPKFEWSHLIPGIGQAQFLMEFAALNWYRIWP